MIYDNVSHGFIYGIFIDEKCVYVGKVFGKNTVDKRRNEHNHYLRHGTHHSKKLQEYYNDGFEFDFRIIEKFDSITDNELYNYERYFVQKFNTYGSVFGCNYSVGGKGNKGFKPSDESIKQISKTKIKGFEEGLYIKTDGEINGMHILKENDVKEIIRMFYQNISHQEIANMYGVCRQAISHICVGKRWSYLPELKEWIEFKNKNIKSVNHGQKLKNIDAYEIKYLIKYTSIKFKEIAELYQVHPTTISNIKKGKRYKNVDIILPYSNYL